MADLRGGRAFRKVVVRTVVVVVGCDDGGWSR